MDVVHVIFVNWRVNMSAAVCTVSRVSAHMSTCMELIFNLVHVHINCMYVCTNSERGVYVVAKHTQLYSFSC